MFSISCWVMGPSWANFTRSNSLKYNFVEAGSHLVFSSHSCLSVEFFLESKFVPEGSNSPDTKFISLINSRNSLQSLKIDTWQLLPLLHSHSWGRVEIFGGNNSKNPLKSLGHHKMVNLVLIQTTINYLWSYCEPSFIKQPPISSFIKTNNQKYPCSKKIFCANIAKKIGF